VPPRSPPQDGGAPERTAGPAGAGSPAHSHQAGMPPPAASPRQGSATSSSRPGSRPASAAATTPRSGSPAIAHHPPAVDAPAASTRQSRLQSPAATTDPRCSPSGQQLPQRGEHRQHVRTAKRFVPGWQANPGNNAATGPHARWPPESCRRGGIRSPPCRADNDVTCAFSALTDPLSNLHSIVSSSHADRRERHRGVTLHDVWRLGIEFGISLADWTLAAASARGLTTRTPAAPVQPRCSNGLLAAARHLHGAKVLAESWHFNAARLQVSDQESRCWRGLASAVAVLSPCCHRRVRHDGASAAGRAVAGTGNRWCGCWWSDLAETVAVGLRRRAWPSTSPSTGSRPSTAR
jgi:hypothetical protein